MFGYASNETPSLMPLPISLAHQLAEQLAEVRHDGTLGYLRPDGKTQVSVRYRDGRPVAVEKLLISTQHAASATRRQILDDLWETVVVPTLPADLYDANALRKEFLVNPTGRFVIGGPVGDCGLTGRKIIVDTYGGMARHGGGAFSGKDPSKVDRSAAYAARWVAKNIVAGGLADRCEVQVAYAIGVAHPVSVMVETFGTEKIGRARIAALVDEHFDLRPGAFRQELDLHRPIYQKTAAYGHFGRDDRDFTWEQTGKADALREAAGLAAAPRPWPSHGHRRHRRRGDDGLGDRRGRRGRGPARDRLRARERSARALRMSASRRRWRRPWPAASCSPTRPPTRVSAILHTPHIEDLLAAEFVIEAVTEHEPTKTAVFRALDELHPPRRHPRVEHVVDPDHDARRGDGTPAPGARAALLLPGPGDGARRDRAGPRDERGGRDGGGGLRAPRRQARDPLEGPRGLSRQRAADPLPRGRRAALRRRPRHARGHRRRRCAWAAATRWGRSRCATSSAWTSSTGSARACTTSFGRDEYSPPPLLRRMVSAGRWAARRATGSTTTPPLRAGAFADRWPPSPPEASRTTG